MTQIKPFKAVCYNPDKVDDLSRVICPPYDVISKEEQVKYHNASPFNFIHVLLNKEKPKDNESNNKYTRAKKTFEGWLQEGVLKEDEHPCIYFYKQEYKVLGQRHSRLGFIAIMRLEDANESKIFPHENTHSHAKEDRFRLWSSLHSNLSPIFVGFSDKEKKVASIFQGVISNGEPFIDIVDEQGIRHILWRLSDPARIKEIERSLAGQSLLIADGHHRYEVAQQYRMMRLKGKTKSQGQFSFNYVMTYFTNMDSKDLMIFPMHRILKKVPAPLDFLEDYFRIDRISLKQDLAIMLAKAGKNEHAFGLYTREGCRLLRLKSKLLIDEHIKEGSDQYRRLDATILKHFIFDRLNIQSDDIIYTKDINLTTDMVDNHQADASFIMNPVKIQQIQAIALNGERMPPKTTYFYPKVLSGLTVYKME